MEVCISDSGAGFDPNLLPEHPPVTDPDRLNFERGLNDLWTHGGLMYAMPIR